MEEVLPGLKVIFGEGFSSNVYLVEGEKGILAIDAGAFKVLNKEPEMLVLTHAHFDHTGGVGESWKTVYIHAQDMREGPYFRVPKQAMRIGFQKNRVGGVLP